MAHNNSFKLHWKDHEQTRASSLSTLWKNDAFTDLTIVCEDDHIDAHKLILSSSSPVFEKILSRNPHQSSHSLLYLNGIIKSDIERILDFIYSGETNIAQDDLQRFIDVAISFKIKGLGSENNLINDETDVHTEEELNWKESKLLEPDPPEKTPERKFIQHEKVTVDEMISGQVESNVKLVEIDINDEIVTLEEAINDKVKSNDKNVAVESNNTDQEPDEEETEDISIAEYDRRISQLMNKSLDGWSCNKCNYVSGNHHGHMKEHVGQHIEGSTFKCNLCKKTSKSRSALRRHKGCKSRAWSVEGNINIMRN